MKAQSIEEVISCLEKIIKESEQNSSRIGYFAALYKLVTISIRNEISKGEASIFQFPDRMEQFDIIFANRYLEAYTKFQGGEEPTASWKIAFTNCKNPNLLVIQHLFIGMNAHIFLDLGIAAAQLCKEGGVPITSIKKDFNCINTIIDGLVAQVEDELNAIWPTLKHFVKYIPFELAKKTMDLGIDKAREEAWDFAVSYYHSPSYNEKEIISARDQQVYGYGQTLVSPPRMISAFLSWAKKSENSSISENIAYLNGEILEKFSPVKAIAP